MAAEEERVGVGGVGAAGAGKEDGGEMVKGASSPVLTPVGKAVPGGAGENGGAAAGMHAAGD